jgi:hypothetical protein
VTDFRVAVESGERGRVFVRVPFDPAVEWGSRGRVYVTGTIAGHPFDGSLGVRAGVVFLPLSKDWRAAAGVAVGQSVEVRLTPTTSAGPDLPADLATALAAAPAAAAAYAALSGFYQRSYVSWVAAAKAAPTRTRRIATAVDRLGAGHKLPTGDG